MRLYLSIDQLTAGMNEAKAVMRTDDEHIDESKEKLIQKLNEMLEFAKTNLSGMLNFMGFNSIEELNNALKNYNNINLQSMFSAFSAPRLSDVLSNYGIGNIGDVIDYNIILSALQDSLIDNLQLDSILDQNEASQKIQNALQNSNVVEAIAFDTVSRLLGGVTFPTLIIDVMKGALSARPDIITQLKKSARQKNITVSSDQHTIKPMLTYLREVLSEIANGHVQAIADEQGEKIFIQALERIANTQKLSHDILAKRIKRGGIQAKSNTTFTTSVNNDTISITGKYEDIIVTNVDKSIFNIQNKKDNQSIEEYVNTICNMKGNEHIRDQITSNIKKFYWQIIQDYLPAGVDSAAIPQWELDSIIDNMTKKNSGNLGWFFSQSTTKQGGAGMFGEIAGMIYVAILCPKLKANAQIEWAGGVTQGAKPPADIILNNRLQGTQYGIQVKNYTSGKTLSHAYSLDVEYMIDNVVERVKNSQDLMTSQAMSELKITKEEIEAVQNVLVANTFNIPYKHIGNHYESVTVNEAFSATRNELDATYEQALRYMTLISVIMHRLQYQEEVVRTVSANKSELQLQNTLWLINGELFVSSVQILQKLIEYATNALDQFFSVSVSVYLKGTKNNPLADGLKEGKMTIVDYFNYNTDALKRSALSSVNVKIGTNYNMAAFGL